MGSIKDVKILKNSIITGGFLCFMLLASYLLVDIVGLPLSGIFPYKFTMLKGLKAILLVSGLGLLLFYSYKSIEFKKENIICSSLARNTILLSCYIPGIIFIANGLLILGAGVLMFLGQSSSSKFFAPISSFFAIILILLYVFSFFNALVSIAFLGKIIGIIPDLIDANLFMFTIAIIFGIAGIIQGIRAKRILSKNLKKNMGTGLKISVVILTAGLILATAPSAIIGEPKYSGMNYEVTIITNGNETTVFLPLPEGISDFRLWQGAGSYKVVDLEKERIPINENISRIFNASSQHMVLKVVTDSRIALRTHRDYEVKQNNKTFMENYVSLIEYTRSDPERTATKAWIYSSQNNTRISFNIRLGDDTGISYSTLFNASTGLSLTTLNNGWQKVVLERSLYAV